MAICRQACPYNTLDGCKVKEYNAICPLTNTATPVTEYRMTNADHIRAMNDEELAEMLWKTGRNYRAVCADPVVDYNEHRDHLIVWLKQPAEQKVIIKL